MTFDIPQMIATAAIILAVVYGINHLPRFEDMTKGGKALVTFVVLFRQRLVALRPDLCARP